MSNSFFVRQTAVTTGSQYFLLDVSPEKSTQLLIYPWSFPFKMQAPLKPVNNLIKKGEEASNSHKVTCLIPFAKQVATCSYFSRP